VCTWFDVPRDELSDAFYYDRYKAKIRTPYVKIIPLPKDRFSSDLVWNTFIKKL
jgi:hypothetical protein